jgi:hypothetical protein
MGGHDFGTYPVVLVIDLVFYGSLIFIALTIREFNRRH